MTSRTACSERSSSHPDGAARAGGPPGAGGRHPGGPLACSLGVQPRRCATRRPVRRQQRGRDHGRLGSIVAEAARAPTCVPGARRALSLSQKIRPSRTLITLLTPVLGGRAAPSDGWHFHHQFPDGWHFHRPGDEFGGERRRPPGAAAGGYPFGLGRRLTYADTRGATAGGQPAGVFWSRMSASSHTRGHPHAKDQTRGVLSWLESHGRRVVNGRRVLELEMSKVDQLVALQAAGFDVPRTVAVAGTGELAAAARKLPAPFIGKHNQGGKGLGVHLFDSHEEFDAYLASPQYEPPVDGITLLQEYLRAAEPRITRAEVVGGEFIYAICADTAVGGVLLCPADACAVGEA